MRDVRTAAPAAAAALQQWYGADPYARRAGLYSYRDPALAVRWADLSQAGRNVLNSVLAVLGQRDRMQVMSRWWNSANAITALVDYMAVTGDRSYLGPVANTFARAPGTHRPVYAKLVSPSWPFFRFSRGAYPGFINGFYDDEGWWALAWIAAYDLTGDDGYLATASDIFRDMAAGWDDYWGGGIYWGKRDGQPDRAGICAVPPGWKGGYKNAIANELFVAVAAGLGLRYRARSPAGPDQAQYLEWARRGWAWLSSPPPGGVAMINEASLVNDSPNQHGVNDNSQSVWSYNQGVILSGLADLAELSGDPAYLGWAEKIADAFIRNPWQPRAGSGRGPAHPSESGVIDGILHEHNDCGPGGCALARLPSVDSTLFKGIFVRHLARLYLKCGKPAYRQFILTNADSALAQAGPGHLFGANWAAPADAADFVRQTAGLDLINAALRVSQG
ncbi:MAG: glycoside hydrolase family 76 protein [Streptosporangiaceae bacterium]